jgi:hypothetical protein
VWHEVEFRDPMSFTYVLRVEGFISQLVPAHH